MSDRKRWPWLRLGAVALGLGIMLFAGGLGSGFGCDFDTMNVCRPFGLWAGDSFLVVGISGLLVIAGLGIGAIGGILTLVGLWRYSPGGNREKA